MTTSPVTIAPFDLYLFGKGQHWDLYRILGAHPAEQDGQWGWRFAVWAPNAEAVSVVGEFNGWTEDAHPLHPVGVSGVWAGFIAGLEQGALYKYAVRTRFGYTAVKTDPFAFYSEVRPGNASRLWPLDT